MLLYNTYTREVLECNSLPEGWQSHKTKVLFKLLDDEVFDDYPQSLIDCLTIEQLADFFGKIAKDNPELKDKLLVNIWPLKNKCRCGSCPVNELWIGETFSEYVREQSKCN